MNRECHDFRETRRFSRRSLLRAGTAGIAGLNLPTWLRAGASPSATPAGQAHHLPAPVRRPVAHRHLRHEAGRARRDPRRVQADRHRPARPDGHRAPAAVRHGHRPVRPGPLGPSHDEEPQLGDLLQPDRPCAAARRHPPPRHPGALPRLWQHGRPARARSTTRRSPASSPSPTSSATAASRRASTPASWARRMTRSSSARTQPAGLPAPRAEPCPPGCRWAGWTTAAACRS